jgi:pimeloyl-ACP methyl ester carboxylesterase
LKKTILGVQSKLDQESHIRLEDLPKIKGIVSLAGIIDLMSYYQPNGCGSNVANLIGGLPEYFSGRYTEGSPITYLPLGIRQILINGESDNIVPLTHIAPYIKKAQLLGDEIELVSIPGASHFDVITPGSIAWQAILDAFEEIGKN